MVPILMRQAGTLAEVPSRTQNLVYHTTHNRPRMVAATAYNTVMAAKLHLPGRMYKKLRFRRARTRRATRLSRTTMQLRIIHKRMWLSRRTEDDL